MRRGFGMLAACTVLGLGVGIGSEANRAEERPAIGRGPQYFSRSGRTSTGPAAPPTRNYYNELFGQNAAPEPREGSAVEPPRIDNFEDATPLPPSTESEFGATAGGNRVVPAQYTQRGTERPAIQPVQATDSSEPFDFAAEVANEPQPVPQRVPSFPAAPVAETAVPQAVATGTAGLLTGDAPAVPSDDAQTPSVTIQWVKHNEILVGHECLCELVVTNSGQTPVSDLAIEASLPSSVRVVGATPEPSRTGGRLTWTLAALEPAAERRIAIRIIPSQKGQIAPQASVRFTGMTTAKFSVDEPLLKVAMQGPAEVTVGDPASHIVVVSNPGTGTAHNVTIEAMIPAGLEHPRGERLAMSIGPLAPGETRQVRLGLSAVQGGKHTIRVEAKAGESLRQSAESTVHVIAPSVKVALEGPGLRYVGRNAVYRLTLTNDGAAVSNNVRAVHKVPAGFQFVQADKGGKFDPETQAVHWFVGRLEAGQTVQLTAELAAIAPGTHVHVAGASSEHGTGSETRCETQVEGAASLILEIVDLNDPVEVGVETAYEIRVRNEGSAAASNVGLSCELPHGVELLGAKSPVNYVAENGLIVFQSLQGLEPGKAAIYRVQVRGTVQGNQRVRARLTSESIQEPLIFEELTKFYGE